MLMLKLKLPPTRQVMKLKKVKTKMSKIAYSSY